MTTEQPKAPPSQDQPYPPPMVAYPHPHFNGGTYPPPPAPPGAYQPHFFAYAPTDASHPETNGANGVPHGAPFMYPYPPGMLYAYPPPTQSFPVTQVQTAVPVLKPKRKQVKMACTNCATACKRCDEGRPCERCVKYGMSNTCVDGKRKERKKGVKRGPYKRKNKTTVAVDPSSFAAPDGEWQPGTAPSATAPPPAVHAVPPFHAPPPEGFYPVYYPGFAPPPMHEGQNGTDHPQPSVVPFLIPAGFPPYPHYPPPGAVYPPPPHVQPTAIDPIKKSQETSTTTASAVDAAGSQDNDANKTKKKTKTTKTGEQKSKKAKSTTTREPEGDGEEDIEESNTMNGN